MVGRNIKVCLIDIKRPNYDYEEAPLNLLALANYLIYHHIVLPKNIKIINLNKNNDLSEIIVFKPSIIGFSVVTPAYLQAQKVGKILKKKLNVPILIGGHHISGLPDILNYPFDIGVIGEGEGTLADIISIISKGGILSEKNLKTIPNLIFRDNYGKIVKNPSRPLLKANEIRPNYWSLLKNEQIISYGVEAKDGRAIIVRKIPLFSARGCPYNCVFCSRQVPWGKRVSFRPYSLERVAKEIEYLFKKFDINAISFFDDTFVVSKIRLKRLIKKLKNRGLLGKINFVNVFVQASLIDEEFALILKKLGVISVGIGMESGSPKILKYLKRGFLNVSQIKKTVLFLGRQGITVSGSFMLFSPGEGEEDLQKTYKLALWLVKQPNVNNLTFSITTPFPGTKMWQKAFSKKNKTFFKEINWRNFVVYYNEGEIDVTSVVFFKDKLKDKQIRKYWHLFKVLEEKAVHKRESIPGWEEAEKKANSLNASLNARLEIKRRFGRIIDNPKRIFVKAINLKTWKYFFRDIEDMIRR